MNPRYKRWLLRGINVAGAALAVWATWLVVQNLIQYTEQIDAGRFSPAFWLVIALCSAAYGGLSLMLVRAWWLMLAALGVDARFRAALRIYGVSQMGKYVPGNVAQVIGRQAMAQAAGMNGIAVGKTAVIEVVLLCVAAMVFAMIAAPVLFPAWPAASGAGLFVLLAVMVWYLLGSLWNQAMQRAWLWLVLFLFLSAAIFGMLLYLIEPIALPLLPLVLGAYIAAWLIGYVAPGAPAGIGIREVALTWLLGDWVSVSVLTLAVVLGRIVTVVGDLIFLALAYGYGTSANVDVQRRENID